MSNAPKILAKCEVCSDEANCHPPDEVRLVGGEYWMCQTCYEDDDGAIREGWLRLPQASAWVTVREAPAETKTYTKCTSCFGLGTHLDVSRDKKTKCTECDGTGYMETEE